MSSRGYIDNNAIATERMFQISAVIAVQATRYQMTVMATDGQNYVFNPLRNTWYNTDLNIKGDRLDTLIHHLVERHRTE